MADNYTALKSAQKKRYISKETFNSLDLSQIPVGSEYEVVSPIEKGDLSADINNALNKAEKSISEPTNQTTGSDGDVLVKKGGGSEWKSVSIPGVVQGTGQSTTDVMSQKAVTDGLNLLEAKLNENIFKDPTKTYIVWKGNKFPNSDTAQTIFDVGTIIDFGDGGAPTVITEAWTNIKVNHTYFDNTDYHIITITYPDAQARAIRANKYNGCTGLIYILTSGYITSIEEGGFSNCGKLDYLYLPNVNTIGNYAFQGMGTILDIDMPAVTSIGEYCFQGSKYSKHIVFPKLHTISAGALQIFEDVELGPDLKAVTIIKQFALKNCKVLTISDEKQTVLAEQNAFSDKLKRIYVPKSKYSTYTSDWVAYYDKIAYKIDSYDLFLELGKCIPDTEKGEANGVATLDASGKVPSSQLPSYVDDVIDSYIVGNTPFAADWLSLTAGGAPLTPEEGKIYVIVSEGAYLNNSYRWSGTVYTPVGSPIAVVQQKGQSTEDVMSQKAVTDGLNLLEAKLNENIVKDPNKIYVSTSQTNVFIAPFTFDGTIDWGDGTSEKFSKSANVALSHTYSTDDFIKYHLISISPDPGVSNITLLVAAFASLHCQSAYLPNLITNLSSRIFKDATFEEIVIPESVTTMYEDAFENCPNLKRIIMKPTTPPMLSPVARWSVDKIIVPKSSINAYKSATDWSTYADKIVYEVDSSDLPDMSNYVDLNSTQQITGKKQFAQAEFLIAPNSHSGYKVGNPFASSNTIYENGYINFKNKDNSHKGSIKIPSVDGDLNTFALLKDIPDTSNLSSFSVEVW